MICESGARGARVRLFLSPVGARQDAFAERLTLAHQRARHPHRATVRDSLRRQLIARYHPVARRQDEVRTLRIAHPPVNQRNRCSHVAQFFEFAQRGGVGCYVSFSELDVILGKKLLHLAAEHSAGLAEHNDGFWHFRLLLSTLGRRQHERDAEAFPRATTASQSVQAGPGHGCHSTGW